MIVVNILAPIFLLIGLGLFLRRQGFASEEFFRNLNRLIYWVALPALLFIKTASALPQLNQAVGIITVVLAGMLVCIAVGYLLAWRLRLDQHATASFVQGTYRGNIAFVGLPVTLSHAGGHRAGYAGGGGAGAAGAGAHRPCLQRGHGDRAGRGDAC